MSGEGLQVWLTESIDTDEVLRDQGWERTERGLSKEGKTWFARVEPPKRVFSQDVPEAVDGLLPGIAWHIEFWYEGRAKAADQALTRAANAIAKAGHGVITDSDQAWLPRGIKRAVPISHHDEQPPPLLLLTWWTYGGPLATRAGVAALVNTVSKLMPEALPDRWDMIEPPSHKLAVDGLESLIDFLDPENTELKFLWAKKPVYELQIRTSRWGGPYPWFMTTGFHIGIDAGVLLQPGWARHLVRVFKDLSRLIQPFYGEARLDPDPSRALVEGRQQPRPAQFGSWKGVPQAPPVAMVIGHPYLADWPDARSGEILEGIAFHTAEEWPNEPHGGCPVPPRSMIQEPDTSLIVMTKEEYQSWYHAKKAMPAVGSSPLSSDIPRPYGVGPRHKPDYWPFPEERFGQFFDHFKESMAETNRPRPSN